MSNTKIVTANLEDLVLAESGKAQRDLVPGHRIFREPFKREAVNITVSAREDGTLAILDGQHCRQHAINNGDTKGYKVKAHYGLTSEQEADLFLTLNTKADPTATSRFSVRVARGDADAVEIDRIVRNHGWQVKSAPINGCLGAIVKVEKIYAGIGLLGKRESHGELLDATLATITGAWSLDYEAVNQNILGGIARVFAKNGDLVDIGHLVKQLKRVTHLSLRAKGKMAASFGSAKSVDQGVEQAVVQLYNAQKRVGKLEVS